MIPAAEIDLRIALQARLACEDLRKPLQLYAWLAAANALSLHRATRAIVEMCLDEGLPVLNIKEAILQNYLFCGFPTAIEGLIVLDHVLRERGLANPDALDDRSVEDVYRDGVSLCRSIYGRNYNRLMEHMTCLSRDVKEWMIREGYGKVLSRPILTPAERELCIVSALAATRRARQLVSHLKGALHVGVSRAELLACLESLEPLGGPELVASALAVYHEVVR
jgi:alkylhydroperoxidase/carboxymuconolactone decarboxylase family protein YurZ